MGALTHRSYILLWIVELSIATISGVLCVTQIWVRRELRTPCRRHIVLILVVVVNS